MVDRTMDRTGDARSAPAGVTDVRIWEERLAARLPDDWISALLTTMAILLASWVGLRAALGAPIRLIDAESGFIAASTWFAVLASFGVAFGFVGMFKGRRAGIEDLRRLAPLTTDGSVAGLERRWRESQAAALAPSRRMGLLGAGIATLGTLAFLGPPALRADTVKEWAALTAYLWYCLTWIASFWLVFRGFTLMNAEERLFTDVIGTARIDLLDTGPLEVYGRRGIVGMLHGIVAATALALVVVHPAVGPHPLALAGILFFMAKATWDFILTMRLASQAIVSAKQAELIRVRDLIRARRGGAVPDGTPPLSDLLAWEARVERVPEWPVSLGTWSRFVGLLGMPMIGWAGSNLLNWALDRFAS